MGFTPNPEPRQQHGARPRRDLLDAAPLVMKQRKADLALLLPAINNIPEKQRQPGPIGYYHQTSHHH